MKHPALARVFSVLLAILGLILLAVGVRGFEKARNEHRDRLTYAEKFAGRIENFENLDTKMKNAADYNETMTALKTFLEAHEKDAAAHKTDTAIYSATKGGLRMGEQMISSARTEMDELRRQLKDANSRKAFLEGLLTELIASNKSKMPWLDALANTAAGYAVDCYMEDAKLTLTTGKLEALMEAEPSPFDLPSYEPPPSPVFPVMPQFSAFDVSSYDAMQSAYQNAMIQAQSAAAVYQQAGELYVQDMQQYYDDMAQYQMERLNQTWDRSMDAAGEIVYSEQYTYEHALWEKECENVIKEADLHAPCAEIRRLSAALSALVRQAKRQISTVAVETGVYDGMEELSSFADSTVDRLDALSGRDLSGMSNEEFLKIMGEAQEILQMLGDAFTVIASNLNNPAALIAELLEKLHIAEMLAKLLGEMLEKAEQQLQAQLEEMWYQLGETEKDQLKLEAEKLGLDREAALLSKRTMEAEELKELRNNHISARQLLLGVPEVKTAADKGGDLADSARSYLKAYERETARLKLGRLIINSLAAVGGAMALVEIPAAYELIKNRFLLIAPVVICLLCSAGAAAVCQALGLRWMYTAITAAIFALIQLLIVLPKRKRPVYTPKH